MRNNKGLFVRTGASRLDQLKNLLSKGITDRAELAERLGITKSQLRCAFGNLYTRGDIVPIDGQMRRGKHGCTQYRVVEPKAKATEAYRPRSVWSNASSIFSLGA